MRAVLSLRPLAAPVFAVLAMLALTVAARAADLQTIEIASKSGVHAFAVEVATTDQERATGLMDRKSLPEGRGLVFDLGRDQEGSVW